MPGSLFLLYALFVQMATILLFDIGNTHTHVGLANDRRVFRQINIPTSAWFDGGVETLLKPLVRGRRFTGAALCSVVPKATPLVRRFCRAQFQISCLALDHRTICGVGIDYPRPETIGADRLANAIAARARFDAPVVVVDFGTAVTFDVVDAAGNYIGGIIAPGLAAMTDYLHEKTALLPRIKIREVSAVVGKNTEEAMLIGAVHGYRGLVRELISGLRSELKVRKLPVVATGGYARLIASGLPDINAVDPALTLEGVRLVWQAHSRKP